MNSMDKMMNLIDRLRRDEQYDDAIDVLNMLRNVLDIEDNKFHDLIDGLIKLCEKQKNESESEAEEIIDMTEVFTIIVLNFNDKQIRCAVTKYDKMRMGSNRNLNERIFIHNINNDSTIKNVMMSKKDIARAIGTFNPSTKKVKLFE